MPPLYLYRLRQQFDLLTSDADVAIFQYKNIGGKLDNNDSYEYKVS
jgi:hypothetical protein